jgi:hypothetical protein
MPQNGLLLLQDVSERIVARYLEVTGKVDVGIVSAFESMGGRGIDLTYSWEGSQRKLKVKPDPYFGLDSAKVRDRSLVFYREDAGSYAFEAVANSATRQPGWILDSEADDIYYYFLALGQAEDEVRALLGEPDEVFFSELRIERDDLRILPMRESREWFELEYENYAPRPVVLGGVSAWYRLVPRDVLEASVAGIRKIGPIFAPLAG